MTYHLGLHKFMQWFSKVCSADPKGSATSTRDPCTHFHDGYFE